MKKLLDVLGHPAWWTPILTWPVFSATSYTMVSRLREQGTSPRTILDVGANIGQFSVASAKLFPTAKIFAFEPNPASVRALMRNVCQSASVTVFSCALGDKPGAAALNVNSHSHSSSLLALGEHHKQAFPNAREVSQVEVAVERLDDLQDQLTFASPVLLKLDVQGFEQQVLAGACETMLKIDYVLVESSFKPLYHGEGHFRDIQAQLHQHGFVFDRPLDFLKHPRTGEVLQMDALFSRNTSIK